MIGGKILNMMRAARLKSMVPKKYWTENAEYQTWNHNRGAMRKHQGRTTPIEVISGVKADLSMSRVFGCETFVLIRRRHNENWTQMQKAQCILAYRRLSRRSAPWRSQKA